MEMTQSAPAGAPGATALLSAKAAWLDQVMGIKVTGVAEAPPVPSSALANRLKTLIHRASIIPDAKRHTDELRVAAAAVKASAVDAEARVDQLRALLDSAERAALAAVEIAEASKPIDTGVVAFAKLRLRWSAVQASRAIAVDRIMQVMNQVLDVELAGDPLLGEARAKVAAFEQRIPGPGPALEDALDALGNTADELQRARARNQALKAIAGYRQALDAEPLLRELQDTEYGSHRIYDEIMGSLQALETVLAK